MKKLFLFLMIFASSWIGAQDSLSITYATIPPQSGKMLNSYQFGDFLNREYEKFIIKAGDGIKIDQIGNNLTFTQDPPFTLTKEQILQLAETSQAAKDLLKIQFPDLLKEVVDLSTTRTNGLNALSIGGGFGRLLLVQLNTSPLQLYPNKSLLVGPSFTAEIVQSGNDQLIIFKQKN